MATPEGVLFERQVILENLLAQKKSNKRKLAAWDLQQEGLLREACFPPPPPPGAAHTHTHICTFSLSRGHFNCSHFNCRML